MGWSAPLDKVFVPRKGKQIKTLASATSSHKVNP